MKFNLAIRRSVYEKASNSIVKLFLQITSDGKGFKVVFLTGAVPTICQHKRKEAQESNAAFVPQCNSRDGSFERTQCTATICYCADITGREMPNTRKPISEGKPNCKHLPSMLHFNAPLFCLQRIGYLGV